MASPCSQDYSSLDILQVLERLFHPRPEFVLPGADPMTQELLIPVEPGVVIGARFYAAGPSRPTILFFHGNGEIVADYAELAPIYRQLKLNFFPVDYRGYVRSTGRPTVSAMMRDCHTIFAFAREWLSRQGFSGPLVLMGRSLGSASALELAAWHPAGIGGLIVESGFAYTGPLLQILGIDVQALGFTEDAGARNLEKIRLWKGPLLVIHAEFDHIIPFAEGQALYDASPSPEKTLLKIAGADHNDILAVGFARYLEAVARLALLATAHPAE